MTNRCECVQYTSDRPVYNNKKPAYLAGFAGVFLAAAFLGAGGVASMRRSTSVGLGSGDGLRFIDGV